MERGKEAWNTARAEGQGLPGGKTTGISGKAPMAKTEFRVILAAA
jgi:hypothetical protein